MPDQSMRPDKVFTLIERTEGGRVVEWWIAMKDQDPGTTTGHNRVLNIPIDHDMLTTTDADWFELNDTGTGGFHWGGVEQLHSAGPPIVPKPRIDRPAYRDLERRNRRW